MPQKIIGENWQYSWVKAPGKEGSLSALNYPW